MLRNFATALISRSRKVRFNNFEILLRDRPCNQLASLRGCILCVSSFLALFTFSHTHTHILPEKRKPEVIPQLSHRDKMEDRAGVTAPSSSRKRYRSRAADDATAQPSTTRRRIPRSTSREDLPSQLPVPAVQQSESGSDTEAAIEKPLAKRRRRKRF